MPINFELDFTQPLLKDLSNAKFANVQEYAAGIAEYYEKAVQNGAPIGISPTLPAPTLSGAPGPVGAGPTGDAYSLPNINASSIRFETVVNEFYTLREILLSKESIEAKRLSLEGVIKKAEYRTKQLQSKVKLVIELKKKIEEAPADIKSTIEAIKLFYNSSIEQIENIRTEIVAFDSEGVLGDIDVEAEFRKKFPDESDILDSLLNIDFSDIPGTIKKMQSAQQYFNSINASTQKSVSQFKQFDNNQQKEYAKRKITQAVTQIFKLSTALLDPTKLGAVLTDTVKQTKYAKEDYDRIIKRGIAASDRLGVLKYYVEPQIKKLEAFIKRKQKEIEADLKKHTKSITEYIDKKAREIFQKQSKIKIPEPSPKFEVRKAKAKKARVDGENIVKVAKEYADLGQRASKLVTKSLGISTAVVTLKDEIIAATEDIKAEAEKLASQVTENVSQLKDYEKGTLTNDVHTYLESYNADILTQTPLVKVLTDGSLNFNNVRKLLQKSDTKYKLFEKKIDGLLEDIEKVANEFIALKESVPKRKNKKPRKNKKENQKVKKNRDVTILSIIQKIESSLIPKVDKIIQQIQQWIKKQLSNAEAYINKVKKQIEIELLAALPIPTATEDAQTKKEAAEEKAQILREFKVKVEKTTKQAKALTLLGTNAATLGTNIASGDISHASNEPALKKIADNIFEFNTVGVKPTSLIYKDEEVKRKVFLSEVDTFREIDTYISVATNIAEDVQNYAELKNELTGSVSSSFNNMLEEVKFDYEELVVKAKRSVENYNRSFDEGPSGSRDLAAVRGVSPIADELISSMEKMFSGDLKASEIIKEVKNIGIIGEGNILSETLNSQPLVSALVQVEQKYLLKTKKALTQIIGIIPIEEEQEEVIEQGLSGPLGQGLSDTKAEIEKVKKAAYDKARNSKAYKALFEMYKAISDGKGSIIAMLIEKLVKLLKRVEAFVKKKIGDFIVFAKNGVKRKVEKDKEEQEQRLKMWLRRKDFVDLTATGVMYNIASTLFWIGSNWQNTVGTTFQVLFVAPMPLLKVNGRIDGYGAAVRELARNLENQLATVTGLCIPNPSLGIPPFPFTGIK